MVAWAHRFPGNPVAVATGKRPREAGRGGLESAKGCEIWSLRLSVVFLPGARRPLCPPSPSSREVAFPEHRWAAILWWEQGTPKAVFFLAEMAGEP